MVYITSLAIFKEFYSSLRTQIVSLKINETFTTSSLEHSNLVDIFSSELVLELSEYTRINNHTINLVNNMQASYRLIYSLKPTYLKTLKTYVKANIVNSFIKLFRSSVSAWILFVQKFNGSFCLYID